MRAHAHTRMPTKRGLYSLSTPECCDVSLFFCCPGLPAYSHWPTRHRTAGCLGASPASTQQPQGSHIPSPGMAFSAKGLSKLAGHKTTEWPRGATNAAPSSFASSGTTQRIPQQMMELGGPSTASPKHPLLPRGPSCAGDGNRLSPGL